MRSTAPRALPRIPILLATVLGCTGAVIGGEDERPGPAGPAGGAGRSGSPGAGSPPVAGPGAPGVAGATGAPGGAGAAAPLPIGSGAVSPVPMRRLTRFEYAATVRDLLGLEIPPTIQLVPEEKVRWFENDAAALTLSPVLAEQVLHAAESLAGRAAAQLDRYVPCAARADDACAGVLVRELGQRAYRRPLAPEEAAALQAVYEAGKSDGGFRTGAELVMRTLLVSPQFLYRIEQGEPAGAAGTTRPSSWEMAARLSYFLLGTMPDAGLFAAAAANRLVSATGVAAEVQRLLGDPRARTALANVMRQWLDLDEVDRMEKLATVFRDWRPALGPLMRREIDTFLETAFWGAEGTLEALYTSPRTVVGRDLAVLYGVPAPASMAPATLELDRTRRAGLLTLLGVLALHAANDDTSPTLRGAFVRERILCGDLPPPPPNVNNQRPPLSTVRTTRERVNQHASDPACSGCHALIDPIGFAFETYDGIGKYRAAENGKPIDDSGEAVGLSIGRFKGAVELARKVGESPEAARCLARQIYRSAIGRADTEADAAALAVLAQTAAGTATGSLKKLLAGVTQTDAFLFRSRPAAPNGGR